MRPLRKLLKALKNADESIFLQEHPSSSLDFELCYGTNGVTAVIELLTNPDSSWFCKAGCILTLGMQRTIGDESSDDIRYELEQMALHAPVLIASFAFPLVMAGKAGRPEAKAVYNAFDNGEIWQKEVLAETLKAMQRAAALSNLERSIAAQTQYVKHPRLLKGFSLS